MMGWREDVNAICARLPGAECSDPWGGGHECWKVGGKIFALQGVEPGVSVKCPDVETAELMHEAIGATRAPYMHRSWIRLKEHTDLDVVAHRVAVSYDLVRTALPAKLRNALVEREQN
jgi:predicted DNA-binding protein (MmcQ/YjbR family)